MKKEMFVKEKEGFSYVGVFAEHDGFNKMEDVFMLIPILSNFIWLGYLLVREVRWVRKE